MNPGLALAALVLAPALALGSFVNVLVARLPRKLELGGRSACLSCHEQIAWYDNIPIVSYVVLRGKCRKCGASISVRYVLVELATALLIAGSFARFGLSGQAFVGAFFCVTLVTVAAIDAEHTIIPDRVVLPATVIALAAQCALYPDRALEWVLAALAASGFLFLALLAYPRGMGMGDVKLALLMGVVLGKTVSVAMAIGMLSALAASLVVFARHGVEARKMKIPFGPFLAFGSVVALFAGPWLLDRYLTLF